MKKILSLSLLLCLVSACTTIKEKVGLVKYQPDEYQVVTNPPLSIPPDLKDVQSPEELEAKQRQDDSVSNDNLSKGENAILRDLN
jgi:hypothetical protein